MKKTQVIFLYPIAGESSLARVNFEDDAWDLQKTLWCLS